MKRLKIKKPYILYVGNAYPHKNLKRLIYAFKLVLEEKSDLSLVLVGKIDVFYKQLIDLCDKLGIKNNVVFTGYVSDKELSYIYSNGLIYVFPSLEEGFGLPGLEAMHKNLPVISSNKGPLPEIYGKAAIYFDPSNIKEISLSILNLINNSDLRQKLIKLGQKQVKKYSWQKCAQQTLSVYEQVYKSFLN